MHQAIVRIDVTVMLSFAYNLILTVIFTTTLLIFVYEGGHGEASLKEILSGWLLK